METFSAPEILRAIQEPGAYGGNPPHWAEAMAARAPSPPYLDKSRIPERALASGLTEKHVPALVSMCEEIAADSALSAFAWYMHWRVFVTPQNGQPWGAPSLIPRLGKRAGLFYQLLALEWESRLKAYHASLGYPSSVTRDTLVQVASYEENHLRGRGVQGLYENQFPWFATYLMGPYVKLGRFEYQLHAYGGGALAWRRKSDGALMLMAEEGRRYGDDGLLLNPREDPSKGWTARVLRDKTSVEGHPLTPHGFALRKVVRLPLPDWELYLQAGDRVLDLHIPAGGKMDWDSMVQSFKQVGPFFSRQHPDLPWKALIVTTWFMDPRLEEVLGPDSNPVHLQRAVHLYPSNPDPGSLWFVFLAPVTSTPVGNLPAETSVQKKLISFMRGGKTWHGGSFLMLPEDVANPRLDAYRERFARLVKEFSI